MEIEPAWEITASTHNRVGDASDAADHEHAGRVERPGDVQRQRDGDVMPAQQITRPEYVGLRLVPHRLAGPEAPLFLRVVVRERQPANTPE